MGAKADSAGNPPPPEEVPSDIDSDIKGGKPAESAAVEPKKKSLRPPSTWYYKNTSELPFLQRLLKKDQNPTATLEAISATEYAQLGPVPHEPLINQYRVIGMYAIPPLAGLAAYTWLNPDHPLPGWAVAIPCVVEFAAFIFGMIAYFNGLQEKYGVFDHANRPRDLVPDSHIAKYSAHLLGAIIVRAIGPILLCYRAADAKNSLSLSWLSPIKGVAWTVVLDYFFYCYHRTTHQVDAFWWIHKTHHGTKHPTVSLTIFADDFQELIEIIMTPTLATLLVPVTFAELWILGHILIFTEAMGHSGARCDVSNPFLLPFLAPFGLDIRLEDHDLHHRYGRSGQSFGKQSGVWDTIFSTRNTRLETPAPKFLGAISAEKARETVKPEAEEIQDEQNA